MTGALLDVQGLGVGYRLDSGGEVRALTDVSFTLAAGETVGIVGESGSGKSTLGASLLGLLPANGVVRDGRVLLGGRDVVRLGGAEARRIRGSEIALIPQDAQSALNPVFTIGTQMVAAQQAHNGAGASRAELRRRAAEALSEVSIPDAAQRLDDYPHQFSGGQCQRIMIATALLLRPRVLVADEPTSALDVTLKSQILDLLRYVQDTYDAAIALISHDFRVVSAIADRILVLYAGRVVEEATREAFFERPLHPYSRALLAALPTHRPGGAGLPVIPGRVPNLARLPAGCTFAERDPLAQPVCVAREPALLGVDGRQVRCHLYDAASGYDHGLLTAQAATAPSGPAAPPPREPSAGTLVELRDVHVHFGARRRAKRPARDGAAVRAVDGVDLAIGRGEVVGLVGESGSGKTTLGRSILRLVERTSGEIRFDGADVHRLSSKELRRLRRRAQLISQSPYAGLSPRHRVGWLLQEPYEIHGVRAAERRSSAELLELVGLSAEHAGKYPHELSGGQARRVGIARALAVGPEFVVADEPTSGLDASVAAGVLNLLRDLAGRLGLAILLITHDLNVVAHLADRVAVMYLGRLAEVGPVATVLETPAHPYTRALLAAASEPGEGDAPVVVTPGEIPSPRRPPPGCRFHTRCPYAVARCREAAPPLERTADGAVVACHRWREVRSGALEAEPGDLLPEPAP